MTNTAIKVENLGKRYRIGAEEKRPDGFWHVAKHAALSPFDHLRRITRPPTEEEILWALKNVSFEVERGEVLGIIGRNGAGKTTLLKILSRITEPTEGEAIINGRVGSLLEVGTGFHHELTGRENVYLNGAILGMTRAEIDRKFDEIVAFSGIERFIDTPVKRYSSGMSVRLAFAVAAHLEPEILLIDEVLAVGDASFQNKCLGKMGEVAKEGRTVLFVSHNLSAVQGLCSRAILLDEGQVEAEGTSVDVVEAYLSAIGTADPSESPGSYVLQGRGRDPKGPTLIRAMRLRNGSGETTATFRMGSRLVLEVELGGLSTYPQSECIAVFSTTSGQRVFTTNTRMTCRYHDEERSEDELAILTIPKLPLAPGKYWIDLAAYQRYQGYLQYIDRAGWVEVVEADVYGTGYRLRSDFGVVYADAFWEMRNKDSRDGRPQPRKPC